MKTADFDEKIKNQKLCQSCTSTQLDEKSAKKLF